MVNEGGVKGVAGSHGIRDMNAIASVFANVVGTYQQATVGASCDAHHFQVESIAEPTCGARLVVDKGNLQELGHDGKLFIVDLHDVGQFGGLR